MPGFRGNLAVNYPCASKAGVGPPVAAAERIDAACRQTAAGRLAARDLAEWVCEFGLSEAEFRLLWLLYRGEALGEPRTAASLKSEQHPAEGLLDQAKLAARLVVSTAQVSGVVERLQTWQLIAGVRDSGDRRRQMWRLTETGEALLQTVTRCVAHRMKPTETLPPSAAEFEGEELPEAA